MYFLITEKKVDHDIYYKGIKQLMQLTKVKTKTKTKTSGQG